MAVFDWSRPPCWIIATEENKTDPGGHVVRNGEENAVQKAHGRDTHTWKSQEGWVILIIIIIPPRLCAHYFCCCFYIWFRVHVCFFFVLFSPSVNIVQRHLDYLHPYQPPLFRPRWNLVPVFHPETASVCQQGVSADSVPSPSKSAFYSIFRVFYIYRHHELS